MSATVVVVGSEIDAENNVLGVNVVRATTKRKALTSIEVLFIDCKIATFAHYGNHLQAALRNALANTSPRCYHSHQAARLALWQTSTRQDRQHPCSYLRLGVVAAIGTWSHAVRHSLGRLCWRRTTSPSRTCLHHDHRRSARPHSSSIPSQNSPNRHPQHHPYDCGLDTDDHPWHLDTTIGTGAVLTKDDGVTLVGGLLIGVQDRVSNRVHHLSI